MRLFSSLRQNRCLRVSRVILVISSQRYWTRALHAAALGGGARHADSFRETRHSELNLPRL
jgi:hypothetical protein